jgi:hypothetical protein
MISHFAFFLVLFCRDYLNKNYSVLFQLHTKLIYVAPIRNEVHFAGQLSVNHT